MKETLVALGGVLIAFICDSVTTGKKSFWDYFFWFLLIISCICFTKVYCTQYSSACVVPHDSILFPEKEFKFIPKGVPYDHVGDDDKLSAKAIKAIKATDKQRAYTGLEHHSNRAQYQEDKLKDMCLFCPNINLCDALKYSLSTSLAVKFAPTAHAKMAAVFISTAIQLGCSMLDNWNEMYTCCKMAAWHSHVAHEYEIHIAEKGWR